MNGFYPPLVHLTIGRVPLCNCGAARAVAQEANVALCEYGDITSAMFAAGKLAQRLEPGTVAVVFGPCPTQQHPQP